MYLLEDVLADKLPVNKLVLRRFFEVYDDKVTGTGITVGEYLGLNHPIGRAANLKSLCGYSQRYLEGICTDGNLGKYTPLALAVIRLQIFIAYLKLCQTEKRFHPKASSVLSATDG